MKTLAFIALFATAAQAQSSRVTYRNGTVEVLRNGQWVQILAGAPVIPGEKVRTGTDSSAAIDLGSGQVILLSANSEIQLGDTGKRTYVADGAHLLPPGSQICESNAFYPYIMLGDPKPAAPITPGR